MDTSSNKTAKHSPTRAKLRKRIAKITPDIESIKQRNQRARTNKNYEDDMLTISSSSKDTSKGIGTEPNKNPEETIKNASLRIKQKQGKH